MSYPPLRANCTQPSDTHLILMLRMSNVTSLASKHRVVTKMFSFFYEHFRQYVACLCLQMSC